MYGFDEKKKISSLFVHYIASFRPKNKKLHQIFKNRLFFFLFSFFSRIRRKFRISRRAERVNYRPLKHPMDGRVEGSRVTQLRVANSYARNRKLARVCVQQMRRPREPRSEIFRALSLSSTPNARGGGRGRPLLCPAFGETRNRKSSSRMDCFPFFFFLPLFSLSFFFPTSISTSIIFVLREKLTFFFMVLVREDLFPSDTNITCLVRNR